MRHEMLSQRTLFVWHMMAKKGMLSQHFVTHVVPPLVKMSPESRHNCCMMVCDIFTCDSRERFSTRMNSGLILFSSGTINS